jgi:SNF2 family DNA or RNA helicase
MSAQNQATDRAYRIGQTNNVQVYKLIMKNSIEEKIQKLQEQKQDLSNMFIENNNGSITQMSTADIIDLFK